MKNYVIVTGGCGFISSALCEILLKNYNDINIDSLTYAGSLKNTKKFKNNLNYLFFKLNINNPKIEKIIKKYKPKYIINCAAETHVDNSIKNPKKFLTTNVMATYDFFLMCMKYWMSSSFLCCAHSLSISASLFAKTSLSWKIILTTGLGSGSAINHLFYVSNSYPQT